jgi:hypothetical protein
MVMMMKKVNVKCSCASLSTTPRRHAGEGEVQIHVLTLALDGVEWSGSRPCCSTLGVKPPVTIW